MSALGDNLIMSFIIIFFYCISSVISQRYFPSKTIQKFLGLFRKSKTHIIAKFLRTDLVIRSHSREGKTCLITK